MLKRKVRQKSGVYDVIQKFCLNHLLSFVVCRCCWRILIVWCVCIISVKSFFIEDEQMSKHTWAFGLILLYYIIFVTSAAIVVAVFFFFSPSDGEIFPKQ